MSASKRTDDEIREQIAWCRTSSGEPTNRWPGQSYESGVEDALLWILGDVDDLPIESDPDEPDDDDEDAS